MTDYTKKWDEAEKLADELMELQRKHSIQAQQDIVFKKTKKELARACQILLGRCGELERDVHVLHARRAS